MSSLAELREIEEQRLLSERAARIAEEEARVLAKEHAARAIREAEERRIAEERAAALALEETRLAAEREARVRVEAAEAGERARHQAALDEQRLAQEMDIAREIARRTKPTWMVAVTIGAVLATAGLAAFAVNRMNQADEAERSAQAAQVEKDRAKQRTKELGEQLALLDTQSADLATRLNKAIDDAVKAEGAAAAAEARRKLEGLRKEKEESDQRKRDTQRKLEEIQRKRPVDMKKCLDGGSIGNKDCLK